MQLLGTIKYFILRLFSEVINSLVFMLLFTSCWNHHVLHVIKQPTTPLGEIYWASLDFMSVWRNKVLKLTALCSFPSVSVAPSLTAFSPVLTGLTAKAVSGHLQKGVLRLTKLAEVACNKGEAGSLLGGRFKKVVSPTRPIVLSFHSEPTSVNRE